MKKNNFIVFSEIIFLQNYFCLNDSKLNSNKKRKDKIR